MEMISWKSKKSRRHIGVIDTLRNYKVAEWRNMAASATIVPRLRNGYRCNERYKYTALEDILSISGDALIKITIMGPT